MGRNESTVEHLEKVWEGIRVVILFLKVNGLPQEKANSLVKVWVGMTLRKNYW